MEAQPSEKMRLSQYLAFWICAEKSIFIIGGAASKRAGIKCTHGYLSCAKGGTCREKTKRGGKADLGRLAEPAVQAGPFRSEQARSETGGESCLLKRAWKSGWVQSRQGGWDFQYRHHGDLPGRHAALCGVVFRPQHEERRTDYRGTRRCLPVGAGSGGAVPLDGEPGFIRHQQGNGLFSQQRGSGSAPA